LKLLNQYDLPVSNKVIFHGPSGCGKTLAAYVLAGELQKMMAVVNLGAIVSPKLGETSKSPSASGSISARLAWLLISAGSS
jgi:AAA+ superfamily predicted ATPase